MPYTIKRRHVPEVNAELSLLHPVLQRIYAARGVQTIENLNYKLANLYHFQSLNNINLGCELLYEALKNNYKITIVGDFDVDGATSTALSMLFLQELNFDVDYFIPNRFIHGYGLSTEVVTELANSKTPPQLILTVDNGISSIEGVKTAQKYDIKVLITDHHMPGETIPNANVVINPNLIGDEFPSKNLAGVGVVYYLFIAFRAFLIQKKWLPATKINLAKYLDLVALGTVADVVPLDANNRRLVYNGIQRIKKYRCRPGIVALLQVADREVANLVASDLGFIVGPRLNAAGRLDDMRVGVECLLAQSLSQAMLLAQKLDHLNQERKDIENSMKNSALIMVDKLIQQLGNKLPFGICLHEDSWHQGVIGIVAARIKESTNRPVIAFANDGKEHLKGSCRSINGVNIRDILQIIDSKHAGLIGKFGGHAMAAGLSLPRNNFAKFKEIFNKTICEAVNNEEINGIIYTDGELNNNDFNVDFANMIKNAGPWGQHFSPPIFDGNFRVLDSKILIEKHLKLTLSLLSTEFIIEAIYFNCDHLIDIKRNLKNKVVKLAYSLNINYFHKQKTVQLILQHLEVI